MWVRVILGVYWPYSNNIGFGVNFYVKVLIVLMISLKIFLGD